MTHPVYYPESADIDVDRYKTLGETFEIKVVFRFSLLVHGPSA